MAITSLVRWACVGVLCMAQAAVAVTTASGNATPPGTATPPPHVSVLSAEQVIQILDDTVDWYRTLGAQQQNANQPSDLLILFANRQTADQVVGLAFEIARANAELLSSEAAATDQSAADASSPQALDQQQAQLATQRQAIQQEMSTGHLGSGRSKRDMASKLPELQGELAMVEARKNLLDTMTEFVNESDSKGAAASALKQQIDAIAASLPTASALAAPGASAAPPVGAGAAGSPAQGSAAGKPASSRNGIWELGTNVMQLRRKIATIDVVDRRTAALAQTFERISALPLKQLKAYSTRSDVLAQQADGADSAVLKGLRGEFDTLAWLFKQTAAILVPLSKEQVLLRQYRHNLASWQEATRKQYREALQVLGIRLSVLLGILAAVFVLGEIWRRAVSRYAHEARHRYQLLLIRKIVVWTVVVAIVGLSFITELSALATFAGLLTAGVAVAMQSVLVSVVGYFFLIGKYGIRVGDRIQIGTVVGEVIDLGLVRMHLMELNTQGPLGPTGRVVAFANLIVFQASGGLFKQIPGVNLSWHETTLTLPEVGDYAALKAQLLTVVTDVVNEYRHEIVRQTQEIARTTASTSVNDAVPHVQMHIANGRMEATVRYPVSFEHAGEIEERVSEAVLKVIASKAAATTTASNSAGSQPPIGGSQGK